jgi:hypothetical protein
MTSFVPFSGKITYGTPASPCMSPAFVLSLEQMKAFLREATVLISFHEGRASSN